MKTEKRTLSSDSKERSEQKNLLFRVSCSMFFFIRFLKRLFEYQEGSSMQKRSSQTEQFMLNGENFFPLVSNYLSYHFYPNLGLSEVSPCNIEPTETSFITLLFAFLLVEGTPELFGKSYQSCLYGSR
jgi:hypothetical protein